MRKILAALVLISLVIFITSCKAPPKLEVEVAEEDIGADISEINTLEEDLNMSELEELDTLIEELESGIS